jgi:hypothetical protein
MIAIAWALVVSNVLALMVLYTLLAIEWVLRPKRRKPAPCVDWYALSFGAKGKVLPKDAP